MADPEPVTSQHVKTAKPGSCSDCGKPRGRIISDGMWEGYCLPCACFALCRLTTKLADK